jgi:hypothetical protein
MPLLVVSVTALVMSDSSRKELCRKMLADQLFVLAVLVELAQEVSGFQLLKS